MTDKNPSEMRSPAIPLISVQQLADKLKSGGQFVLIDVRETWEVELARIQDSRLVVLPMSQLSRAGVDALPEAARSHTAELLILCHQGVRSAQVTAWLASKGWTNVFS